MEKTLIVTMEEAGQRLDRVLARLTPVLGLRGRRRLCGLDSVLVNARPTSEAYKVHPGDVVNLIEHTTGEIRARDNAGSKELRGPQGLGDQAGASLVLRAEHFAALFKPAGMHTETLAGKWDESLQSRLPMLLGAASACSGVDASPCSVEPKLLNRLDFPTSGLVLAALDEDGAEAWRAAQQAGLTEKRYLALLEGVLDGKRVARQRLSLKGREKVLVELAGHPDVHRHTCLTPLAVLSVEEVQALLANAANRQNQSRPGSPVWNMAGLGVEQVTLAACVILKGARHQIRAHASALGFPLLGDRRYGACWTPVADGEPVRAEQEHFFLHHGGVRLPDFAASCPPPWLDLLPETAAKAARSWLQVEV